jgi:tetratricopeptide (TPR) repeat protein
MKIIKTLPFLYFLCMLQLNAIGQKKVDQPIPNAEKKRIEQAQKLFNQYKIYEGEKIIHDLINQHPNESYYYETLVQLQRQVLRKLTIANQELLLIDTLGAEDSIASKPPEANSTSDTVKYSKLLIMNGLDRFSYSFEENISKQKRTTKIEDVVQQEAIVTIDSSIIAEDNDDPIEEINHSIQTKSISKESRALQRKIKFLKDFSSIPYEPYKQELIRNARQATRMVEFADSASYYLNELLIDTINFNTIFSEIDLSIKDDAFEAYRDDNYVLALKLLKELIKMYPNDYLLRIKLGDTYYMIGKDTMAINQYIEAKNLKPNSSLAYEKIALTYYNRGKFLEASSLIIDAIAIYPHQHYFNLLKRIVAKSGKGFETQWLQRPVFPVTTSKNYVEIAATEKSPWVHYQFAENEMHSYFDTNGIVRPNEKTRERYLEVYAWKKMLDRSGNQYFSFARAMNQIGYLDCYVLVTLFHHDVYGQLHDFALRNPDKIKDYFYMLINWDDKKFDKLRKQVAVKKEVGTKLNDNK